MGMGDYDLDKVSGVSGLERLLDILDEGKQKPIRTSQSGWAACGSVTLFI